MKEINIYKERMCVNIMDKKRRVAEKIGKKIKKILVENNIDKAGIFGSYATGKQGKASDIDILVEINNQRFSLVDFIRLKLKLEGVLKKKVDLVEYKTIKPALKKIILNQEIRVI